MHEITGKIVFVHKSKVRHMLQFISLPLLLPREMYLYTVNS